MEKLVKSIVPDLTHEETKWLDHWVQGPLAASSQARRHSMGPDVVVAKILGSFKDPAFSVQVQSVITRLETKSDHSAEILKLMWLLRDRASPSTQQPEVVAPTTPLVTAALIHETTADPTLTRIALSSVVRDHISLSERQKRFEEYSFGSDCSERKLVQDLAYVLQGIDGQFVMLGKQEIRISPALNLASHVEAAIKVLGETGILHNRIKQSLQVVSKESPSVLFDAFRKSIEKLLSDFIAVAALIDGDVDKWTILKLLAWLAVPIRRMRAIYALVQRVVESAHRNKCILDTLYLSTQKRVFKSVFDKVFTEVVSVWLDMVALWATKGRLLKEHESDFFIRTRKGDVVHPKMLGPDTDKTDSWQLWHNMYYVEESMVPSFVSAATAKDILLIGKGLAFIRNSCAEMDWFEICAQSTAGKFKYLDRLRDDVVAVGKMYNPHVVHLVLEKYLLIEHVASIRKYMLLSQGDFADALMTHMSEELSKPALDQNKFELASLMDSAVRQSSVHMDPEDRFERLHVLLGVPGSASDTGFEIMTINYSVLSPIDVVLTPDALRVYQRCFSSIWETVRCESILAGLWKELVVMERKMSQHSLPLAAELLFKCNFIRSDLFWFIHELRSVICYEVVQTEWNGFASAVAGSHNMDKLIACHDEYLQRLTTGLFLSTGDDDLNEEIHNIFNSVHRFANSFPAILSELLEAIDIKTDLSEYRHGNMEGLVEDIHESFHSALVAFMDLVEERKQDEERSDFFNRISDRLKLNEEE